MLVKTQYNMAFSSVLDFACDNNQSNERQYVEVNVSIKYVPRLFYSLVVTSISITTTKHCKTSHRWKWCVRMNVFARKNNQVDTMMLLGWTYCLQPGVPLQPLLQLLPRRPLEHHLLLHLLLHHHLLRHLLVLNRTCQLIQPTTLYKDDDNIYQYKAQTR